MRKSTLLLILAAFALRALAADRVTVEQLQQALAAAHGKQDKEVALKVRGLELTERLSAPRLESLKAGMPGDESKQALLALADASAFLDLPAADILKLAPPDSATQGKTVSRAADFVVETVTRMPDFFASRTTTRFQNVTISASSPSITSSGSGQQVLVSDRGFHLVDRVSAIVTYRNGREVVEPVGGKKRGMSYTSLTGLTNWGVFGPLLGVVMTDILKGKIGWSHWEQGPAGPLAVFRYAVEEDRSNYTVRYCCFRSENGEMKEFKAVPAYHGEIAIDPASGAILRLVLKTDLLPGLPMERIDLVVNYGPVEIGGKTYICPTESTSISKSAALVFFGFMYYDDKKGKPDDSSPFNKKKQTTTVSQPLVTAINDVVFDNYHQFRGEVRIVPSDNTEQDGNPAPSAPATVPATPPRQ
jgi:hypothetical protein